MEVSKLGNGWNGWGKYIVDFAASSFEEALLQIEADKAESDTDTGTDWCYHITQEGKLLACVTPLGVQFAVL